jgi:hypothetical protein
MIHHYCRRVHALGHKVQDLVPPGQPQVRKIVHAKAKQAYEPAS